MRRPSVFVLLIVALLLVGIAMAVVAAVNGSVALVLAGVGLVLLGGAVHLSDRRTQAAHRSLDQRLQTGFEAVRQDLTGVASVEDLAEVRVRLGLLDVRLDKAQRRLLASSEAARLAATEPASGVRGAD